MAAHLYCRPGDPFLKLQCRYVSLARVVRSRRQAVTQSSSPIHTQRPVAVGVFDSESGARQAAESLGRLGQVTIAGPDMRTGWLETAGDLAGALASVGVPEGQARFYAHEVDAGRCLVVVEAGPDGFTQARDLLRQHGARDVQSEGKELVRGSDAFDGVSGGTVALDADLTGRWEDVRSRYETLFEQHYGTTDTSWAEVEPVYRYAWQMANRPELRGRPWSEVEPTLQRDWAAWPEVAGPIRDVWEDVAAESSTPEGGADRRVPRQGADQSGPASEVVPPPGPA
jgi:hypothetical protein